MGNVFSNLMSWSLVIGIVIGFVLSKLWQLSRVCWLEKNRPLADGRKRSKWKAIATDRRWLVGMVAVAFLGWSVFTTSSNASANQRNAAEAAAFAKRVHDCQQDLIASIAGSRSVSTDNDRLSREERGLLADGQRLGAEWIGSLLNPPAAIAALTESDPLRQRYNVDRTQEYFDRTGAINRRIDAVHVEQSKNDGARPALPDLRCGE